MHLLCKWRMSRQQQTAPSYWYILGILRRTKLGLVPTYPSHLHPITYPGHIGGKA